MSFDIRYFAGFAGAKKENAMLVSKGQSKSSLKHGYYYFLKIVIAIILPYILQKKYTVLYKFRRFLHTMVYKFRTFLLN
jgi:hypothetical protein